MQVRWEVEDGYAGKSRPQSFDIDIEEMAATCDTDAEAHAHLEAAIQDAFDQRISWYCKNTDEVLAAWSDMRAQRSADAADDTDSSSCPSNR